MWNEEIEKAVLFYVIYEQEAFVLNEDDFVSDRNRKIVRAINELKSRNEEISIFSISSRIKANKNQVLKYLSGLGEYVRTATADSVYKELIQLSKKRKIFDLLKSSQETVIEDADDIDIIAQSIVQNINKIEQSELTEKNFMQQVSDTVETIENNVLKGMDYSLYTGIQDLDDMLCGLHRQELTIIRS